MEQQQHHPMTSTRIAGEGNNTALPQAGGEVELERAQPRRRLLSSGMMMTTTTTTVTKADFKMTTTLDGLAAPPGGMKSPSVPIIFIPKRILRKDHIESRSVWVGEVHCNGFFEYYRRSLCELLYVGPFNSMKTKKIQVGKRGKNCIWLE